MVQEPAVAPASAVRGLGAVDPGPSRPSSHRARDGPGAVRGHPIDADLSDFPASRSSARIRSIVSSRPAPAWPRRSGRRHQGDVDLADPRPPATPEELPGLVRRDRRKPGSEMLGLAQARQLPPRDRPRGLGRVMGQVGVAADEIGDPDQVVVVLRHDPAERDRSPAAADAISAGERASSVATSMP